MTIAVGDVLRISQGFRVDGSNCVVSAHYQLFDAGTATTDTELVTELISANWVLTFISGSWRLANADGVVATCLKVKKILPVEEDDFVFIQNVAGALVTDWLPAHSAAMVTKTSKSSTRGNSGRSFFPAPPEIHFPEGRLDVPGFGLWGAVASFLNDQLTLGAFATSWTPVHIQAGGVISDVFRAWINPNIRTVRSRQAVDCAV